MHDYTPPIIGPTEVKTDRGWRRLEVPKTDEPLLSIAGSVLKGLEGRKRLRAYRKEKVEIVWARPEQGDDLYCFDVVDKDGNKFSISIARAAEPAPNPATS